MTKLTTRDQQILQSLCTKVRVFTLQQLADAWWHDAAQPELLARRRLAKLAEVELVRRHSVSAMPLPPLDTPLIQWRPGQRTPDFGAAAWKAQNRWKESARQTIVYSATSKSANLFGGKPTQKLKSAFQITHDLGVAAMFLTLLRTDPQRASRWIGEDLIAPFRKHQKLPDAVIADSPASRPAMIYEFAGQYPKSRIAAFHHDCARRRLPYELG